MCGKLIGFPDMCLLTAESLLTPSKPEADYHLSYKTVQAFLALDVGGEERRSVFHAIADAQQATIFWELFTAEKYLIMDRVLLLHAYIQSFGDDIRSEMAANGGVSMTHTCPFSWKGQTL